MKTFLIRYEVDTGCDYKFDNALVKAEDKQAAEEDLRKYIGGFGGDYAVSAILDIRECDFRIFTCKHGFY